MPPDIHIRNSENGLQNRSKIRTEFQFWIIYIHGSRYGMKGLGIVSLHKCDSPHPSIKAVERIQPSVKWVSVFFIGVKVVGAYRCPTTFSTEIKESVLL